MAEQVKTELSCGIPWYPLRKWQSSRAFSPDVGLEPWDPRWMDVERLQRTLAACSSWPGYVYPTPLFVPHISGSMNHPPDQKISKAQYKWRVSLDVSHFSSSEISLQVRDTFLEISGRHEERADEHGFIARCFTRKYRLPVEIDVTTITSSLSVDGILTVEASVPETSVPAAVIIPIKVEMEASEEKQGKENKTDTDLDSVRAPDAPECGSAEADVEESPLGVQSEEAPQPDSATAGTEQHEDSRELEEEESREKPDGESQHSAPADGEGAESFQGSSEHHQVPESQESSDTDLSKEPEHEGPQVEVEIQVMTPGSVEVAGEIAKPEEPELGDSPPSQEVLSQEVEVPDIKQ